MAFQSSLSSVLLMIPFLGDAFLVTKLFRLSVYFVRCLPKYFHSIFAFLVHQLCLYAQRIVVSFSWWFWIIHLYQIFPQISMSVDNQMSSRVPLPGSVSTLKVPTGVTVSLALPHMEKSVKVSTLCDKATVEQVVLPLVSLQMARPSRFNYNIICPNWKQPLYK